MNSKEKLFQLEAADKHLFHGSPDGTIEILEPRQSTHIPDLNNPDESILDGQPAVAATPYAELATFRAIINGSNVPIEHSSGFGITDGEKSFRVSSADVLEQVKDKKGFVYVFDKKDFKPYDRENPENPSNGVMEWRSHTPVTPINVVEVSSDDLPHRDRIRIGNEE